MTYAAFLSAAPAVRSVMVSPNNAFATTALNLAPIGEDGGLIASSSILETVSHSLASAATTSTVYASTHTVTTAQQFDPILPDTPTLLGILAIVLASAAATWVWANQVVPTSRTKLALSKRDGDVKEYLEKLQQAAQRKEGESDRQFEQWLFTDWLEQASNKTKKGGRQKEPALPILKNAKWNSVDNPVLAATALIMAGVVFASVTEQLSSFFS